MSDFNKTQLPQLAMREATQIILEYLEAWSDGFRLADADISPSKHTVVEGFSCEARFIGNAIYNAPRPGKDFEYCGQVFFNLETPKGTFFKCPIMVSINQHANAEIMDDVAAYHAQYGNKDIALLGAKYLVRRNANNIPYLSLQLGGDWEYWGAWIPQMRPHTEKNSQAVTKFVSGGGMSKTRNSGQMIVTQFLADLDVYDAKVIVPEKGPISFRGQQASSLDELFPLLISSPNFIRTYDEMEEETFAYRVELLASLLDELVTSKYRTDWDGYTDDMVDDAALKVLKILQPTVKKTVVSVPTPPPTFFFNIFGKK